MRHSDWADSSAGRQRGRAGLHPVTDAWRLRPVRRRVARGGPELRDGGYIGPGNQRPRKGMEPHASSGQTVSVKSLMPPQPIGQPAGDVNRHLALTGLDEHRGHSGQMISQEG